jgi:adenylate kinase family enzyme
MDRIAVVGNCGTGKTFFARRLAQRLRVPCTELDAMFHQAGWTELEETEFRRQVATLVERPRWVIDGNYKHVRDLIWGRADTVVWLDLPRLVVLRRVVWRTARRVATRQVLWNGNRERLRNSLAWQPERSIIRWSWTQHAVYRERYVAAMQDPALRHHTFRRPRSSAEVTAFLARSGRPVSVTPWIGIHAQGSGTIA